MPQIKAKADYNQVRHDMAAFFESTSKNIKDYRCYVASTSTEDLENSVVTTFNILPIQGPIVKPKAEDYMFFKMLSFDIKSGADVGKITVENIEGGGTRVIIEETL